MLPDAAAVLAFVVPADLQIQEIEPAVGTVPEANATPEATLPSTGVMISVPPLSIPDTYVTVIAPFEAVIPTELTALVDDGAVQPEANGAPLAAFSETEVFAAPAKDKPSVTLARTV